MALSNVKGLDKRADRLDVKLGDSDGVCKKHMAIAPVKHTKVPMILALLYQQHASNFSNLQGHPIHCKNSCIAFRIVHEKKRH